MSPHELSNRNLASCSNSCHVRRSVSWFRLAALNAGYGSGAPNPPFHGAVPIDIAGYRYQHHHFSVRCFRLLRGDAQRFTEVSSVEIPGFGSKSFFLRCWCLYRVHNRDDRCFVAVDYFSRWLKALPGPKRLRSFTFVFVF